MVFFFVQTVQVVQAVQTPSFILPRDAGGKRWRFERSEAVELSVQKLSQRLISLRLRLNGLNNSLRDQYSNTPIASMSCVDK